jgi:hypothetical protein
MSPRAAAASAAALVGLALAVAAAGCSPTEVPPPSRPIRPASPPSQPAFSPSPPPRGPAAPSLLVSPSARFADDAAVNCAGYPSGGAVISLLRSKGVVARGSSVTVRSGPLCAGSWQYTILLLGGQEELQVVTTGTPSRLRLITAGTYVCTAEVLTQAPAGILTAAQCS